MTVPCLPLLSLCQPRASWAASSPTRNLSLCLPACPSRCVFLLAPARLHLPLLPPPLQEYDSDDFGTEESGDEEGEQGSASEED